MPAVPTHAADRYDRRSGHFAALVRGVSADGWDAPTPCEDWSVRDLVGHVVDSHHQFLRMVGREPQDAPGVEEDPIAAFDAARAQTLADLRDPERAATSYDGYFGTRTYAWAVDGFITSDLVIHGWDLARATGQDDTIPVEEIDPLIAQIEALGDVARSPEVYGPPLPVPDDADSQTRLLALVGRRA